MIEMRRLGAIEKLHLTDEFADTRHRLVLYRFSLTFRDIHNSYIDIFVRPFLSVGFVVHLSAFTHFKFKLIVTYRCCFCLFCPNQDLFEDSQYILNDLDKTSARNRQASLIMGMTGIFNHVFPDCLAIDVGRVERVSDLQMLTIQLMKKYASTNAIT